MSLDAPHPEYMSRQSDWVMMRDLYKGEKSVKLKGETYLPATKGMKLDGMGYGGSGQAGRVTAQSGEIIEGTVVSSMTPGGARLGQEQYDAYRKRAVLPDYMKNAVEAYIGLLHRKPATIELPKVMEPMREKATIYEEPLDQLLRRINEEQLVSGRCGLLLDLPTIPDPTAPVPYIALYIAEAIRNWDEGAIKEGRRNLEFAILDESGYMRTSDFRWVPVGKFRVLDLGPLSSEPVTTENAVGEAGGLDAGSKEIAVDESVTTAVVAQNVYRYGVFEAVGGGTPKYDPLQMQAPMLRGQTLDVIPFVFVNTKDIIPSPDEPPLMGLAQLTLAIYRGEADYRQNLFMQGQDTLVIIGDRRQIGTDINEAGIGDLRVGAGSAIELEATPGADAKYAGVSADGLGEQRSALENDYKRAETRAGQLINAGSTGGVESGSALQTRVAAQTATLTQIALTGAAALEQILRMAAQWMGADPEEVKVTPNLEFQELDLTGQDLVQMMTARNMGAPISRQSMHQLMSNRGLTQMTFDEEMDVIDEENAQLPPPAPGTSAGGPQPAPKPIDPAQPPSPAPKPKPKPAAGD